MSYKTKSNSNLCAGRSVMDRAKRLAEKIVKSMQTQGYFDIEYILTENQLKIVASRTGYAPQTTYLMLSDPQVPRHRQ